MPRRTNEFQKLVFLVKRHAAAGSIVTESKMLRDLITGTEREVDISVESDVAGHNVIISIECNAKGRKAHIGWVEEMKTKHDRLPTNVLVLVSRAGFSKEAARVASSYGIHTLSLNNAVGAAVARRLFGATGSLWMKTFRLNPTKVVFDVPPTEQLPGESVVVTPDNLVFSSTGTQEGKVKEVVEMLLRADFVVPEFGSKGDATHKYFVLEWKPPEVDGKRLCLQKMEPLTLRPVTLIRVTGECNFDIAEFRLQHGNLGDVTVAWGTSSVMGRPAMLVASHAPNGSQKISVTTENVQLEKKKTR
jgi:hypothetical protein